MASFGLLWFPATFLFSWQGVSSSVVVNLRGVGGTFPAAVYSHWQPLYKAHRLQFAKINMKYEAIGSGKSKARIKKEAGPEVEYAGSDSLLSEEDYKNHPDLQMIPTMAGAVVLAYNLPGITERLLLSREEIVGIYNGSFRFWNDPGLQDLNPNVTLPDEKILVIASAYKSGTTEMFTHALSSFSQQWEEEYGIFNEGLNETGWPVKWKPGVVSLFGFGNRGTSGVILSIPYTLGYISASEAHSARLAYALVRNRAENVVDAGEVNVQSVMDDFGSAMDSRLTAYIADGGGAQSYPISGLTYMIVYMRTMKDCSSALELVRYIDWFMKDAEARKACVDRDMVPLSAALVQKVRNQVLHRLTCEGQNMWQKLEEILKQENIALQTWRIPVAIISPFAILTLISAVGYFAQQRIKLKAMIDRNEWCILMDKITFSFPSQKMFRSLTTLHQTPIHSLKDIGDVDNGQELIPAIYQWPGKFSGNDIGLRTIQLPGLKPLFMSTNMKKTMLWFRDSIIQENLVHFYGLLELDNQYFIISDYCSKGPITNIIQDEKFTMTNDFKLSLASDVASGMAFLHKQGLVHGHLTSACCLIDARWVVRVMDWELVKFYTQMHNKHPLALVHNKGTLSSLEKSFYQFWVAPEALTAHFEIQAHSSMDMYSFAIIMQEIFSGDDPYAEHVGLISPNEVVSAILKDKLRPLHHRKTPTAIQELMELGWSEDPLSRPNFEQALKLLKNVNPNKKSILDSIIKSMEEYTTSLETRLNKQQVAPQAVKQDNDPSHSLNRHAMSASTSIDLCQQ